MFKKIALIILGLILLSVAGVLLFAKEIEIQVSEAEAQSAINAFIAADPPQSLGVDIEPRSVTLDFNVDNRAVIDSVLALSGHGYSGAFTGRFSAGIDYRFPKLYLDDLTLLNGGFTADTDIRSELDALKDAAINVLDRHRQSDQNQIAETIEEISSEALVETYIPNITREFFERVPVYDISKSGKAGMAASLALKDVRFTEDHAIITLSPVAALLRIISLIGTVLFILGWFLGPTLVDVYLSRRKGA